MPKPPVRQHSTAFSWTQGAYLFLAVFGSALTLFVVAVGLDSTLGVSVLPFVLEPSALDPLGEILAAVLGLSLTVVAIVVQLASQRFSARIVDLFMRDTVNIVTFAFIVVSCMYVTLLPGLLPKMSSSPTFSIWIGLLLTLINFALLLPYFARVFAFLEPNNIITQIEGQAGRALRRVRPNCDASVLFSAQRDTAHSIERITDSCLAAVEQSDRNLALHSARALEKIALDHFSLKETLPQEWFFGPQEHLFSLSQEFYDEIVENNAWVEAKILMEIEHIVRCSMSQMGELTSQAAATTRVLGESALQKNDCEVVELTVRFFNTYIRHALNARNVRCVYNILYQYRLFSIATIPDHPDLCSRVVDHLVYYGQLANAMGLPFVTVTAAHDVRVLCEHVYLTDPKGVRPLLQRFLVLDQRSEGKSEELALLGVRKAQSILGAFFLHHNAHDLAQAIRDDMDHEAHDRLKAIRDSILSVEERTFWEVTDRGFNFDYVEPILRPHIEAFFTPMLHQREMHARG